ncbi:Carbon catabolite repressor protein 4-like 5 [Vitis vinifera]|uniref:Carbon catabolite repressor protein 4-like 5 n=1 Tax=Vitis vinifera TaxID=29760 RepID=A0A438JYL4_VITVI|nr:Carbon catabolite repressor protein 4-like 5 [Vitis vinifera]
MSWMHLHSNNMLAWLQEVDRFNDLNNLLKKGGFKGVYKARTGEAYDGCAMFWKDDL